MLRFYLPHAAIVALLGGIAILIHHGDKDNIASSATITICGTVALVAHHFGNDRPRQLLRVRTTIP